MGYEGMSKAPEGRATELKDAASEFAYKRADGLSMSTGNPETGAYERFHKNAIDFADATSAPSALDLRSGAKSAATVASKGAKGAAGGIGRAIRKIGGMAKSDIDEMEAEAQGDTADVAAMRGVDNATQKFEMRRFGQRLSASKGSAAKRGEKAARLDAKAARNDARSSMFAEKAKLAAEKRDMAPGSGKRRSASFAERWYVGRSRIASFKSRMAERGAEKEATKFGRTKRAGKAVGGGIGKVVKGGKAVAAVAPALLAFLLLAGIIAAVTSFGFMAATASEGAAADGGACIIIPEEYRGSVFTVTEYGTYGFGNGAVDPNSDCYPVWRKWMDSGHKYTNGIATIDGYYLIACTKIFGNVGDRMIWEFEDGTQILCMMADTKDESWAHGTPAGVYGHKSGDSWNNLEFEVDTNWYHRYGNPGSTRWLPEIAGKKPCKVYNLNRAPQGSEVAQKIIECAQSLLGTPYKLGADVGSGYVDCSGLTSYCYAQAGIPIPRTSEDQKAQAPTVTDVSKAQPGDILWMEGHVGIYIGGGRTIEALPQGVVTSTWDKFTKCLHWPQVSSGPSSDVMTPKGQKIVDAAKTTGSPGGSLCAMWVSQVYQKALGYYPGGDARDMYARMSSTDLTTLQPGMCVAVSTHPGTSAGRIYGHVAIYIGGGKVMDNIGYIRTMNLSEWVAYYNKSVPVRCGWL